MNNKSLVFVYKYYLYPTDDLSGFASSTDQITLDIQPQQFDGVKIFKDNN